MKDDFIQTMKSREKADEIFKGEMLRKMSAVEKVTLARTLTLTLTLTLTQTLTLTRISRSRRARASRARSSWSTRSTTTRARCKTGCASSTVPYDVSELQTAEAAPWLEVERYALRPRATRRASLVASPACWLRACVIDVPAVLDTVLSSVLL